MHHRPVPAFDLKWAPLLASLFLAAAGAFAQSPTLPVTPVEGQPLAANVERVLQALDLLGAPLPAAAKSALRQATGARDGEKLQRLLDPRVLLQVTINPEARVKVARGPAPAMLQQGGYTPVVIKVVNQGTVTAPLRLTSPQSGPVYAGVAPLSMQRQQQPHLRENENTAGRKDRFLQVEMHTAPPLTPNLSGLEVEYAVALVYAGEAGRREATLAFDVGQGTQDLGFRAEIPVLFTVRPGVPVKMLIRDHDGKPSTARLTFRDRAGHVFPPQAKRLAPDFFFQQHIYRHDGETVLLPPGELTLSWNRGPEYRTLERKFVIPEKGPASLRVDLQRWIDPMAYGFYCGDHHIHGAGCAHYNSPSEGVTPADMFRNVKGEGLNVGCVLTWGPCYDFQRNFFRPTIDRLSEPFTLLKYDVEVSGFGSQALGHVCLLNLRDQTYPGSDGTKDKGWPTWTTPVMRWAKSQGAVTGYAHSASGLDINPQAAAKRLLDELDADRDGRLSRDEAAKGLLPGEFAEIDASRDASLSEAELVAAHELAADRLPNHAIPEMNSVGAQEICVTVAQGLCDFISSMDTSRIAEWNCWYHLLNCGYPLKTSGETDFPCMSGSRVGQGRVYVQLGQRDRLDFGAWCEGLAKGRSYVSDGYAHALDFAVEDQRPGASLSLDAPREVAVTAKVAFAAQTPIDSAYGTALPAPGKRRVGDTVNKHEVAASVPGGKRLVEIVVNGRVAAAQEVPADDKTHDLRFSVKIDRSSWVALRQFPQLHTNPVNVIVGGKPIRASRRSALWCAGTIRQLWRARARNIAEAERDEAKKTFDWAIGEYQRIANEAPEGS